MANTTKKMTAREFYMAVIEANISDEMTEKATELIEALDSKNAKRKETGTKQQKANTEIKEIILTALENNEIETLENENGKFITAKTTTNFMKTTDEEFTTQRASALLGQLEKDGKLVSEQIKSKSGKVKGYRLNTSETE
jgi:hypothetical protein